MCGASNILAVKSRALDADINRDVATRMVMLISEVEELSQQLNDQYEEEVRSINAEALRELDELRQVR